MRHMISLLTAVFLIAVSVVPAMATSWEPWYAKKQNLTAEQFVAEIARDDKKILRVSSEEYSRQLGNQLGLAAPENPYELAEFLSTENPDITVAPCTTELIRKVRMGRTNKDGSAFDFNFTRTECGKGEQFLFFKGRPIISLWCGNLIIAPLPVQKALGQVKRECFVINFRLTENGAPINHKIRLTAKVWLKNNNQEARDVVYDPCFKVSRDCDKCQEKDIVYTSDIPERHLRKSDDIFEIPIEGGIGELSLPIWYVDPNGHYSAEFLFCSEKEDFQYPLTGYEEVVGVDDNGLKTIERVRITNGIRVLSEDISSVWDDGGNVNDPIVFRR